MWNKPKYSNDLEYQSYTQWQVNGTERTYLVRTTFNGISPREEHLWECKGKAHWSFSEAKEAIPNLGCTAHFFIWEERREEGWRWCKAISLEEALAAYGRYLKKRYGS